MRALLLVALAMGCDDKPAAKTQAPNPVPASAPDPTTASKDTASAKPAPTESAEPAPKVDCDKLVSADDIKQACGKTMAVNTLGVEGKASATHCARGVSEVGKKFPLMFVHVSLFANAAAANTMANLDNSDRTKAIAGLGDRAYSSVREIEAVKQTEHDVGVVKGRLILKLKATQDGKADPVCNVEQLTALARIVLPRLP